MGLRARGCGAQGQARSRRDDRARPADRHAAGHRATSTSCSRRAIPTRRGSRRACATWRRDLIDPRLAAEPMDRDTLDALSEDVQRHRRGARRDHPRAGARTRARRSARWATTRRCRCCRTSMRSLYDYFRQQFAQVTNPPIDPLRESIVMSLQTADRPGVQHLRSRRPSMRAQIVLELADAVAAQAAPDPGAGRRGRARNEFIDLQYDPQEGLQRAIARVCDAGRGGGARRQAGAAAVGSLPGAGQDARCTRCSPPARCTTTW